MHKITNILQQYYVTGKVKFYSVSGTGLCWTSQKLNKISVMNKKSANKMKKVKQRLFIIPFESGWGAV